MFFFTGSSVSDQIIQIPTQTFYKPEDIAELKCSHSIRGYDRIFWYRQTQDQKLQLLGYMIGTSQFPEPQLGVTLAGSADEGQTSTLTIPGLWSRASSGVYYCAARHHSGGSDSSSAQKPSACNEPPLVSSGKNMSPAKGRKNSTATSCRALSHS